MNKKYSRGGGTALLLVSGLVASNLLPALAHAQASEEAQPQKPQTFDVLEYRVLGNTVLPAASIERAVYPHLGPGKSLDVVEQARMALEQAYHAAGYGTVFV